MLSSRRIILYSTLLNIAVYDENIFNKVLSLSGINVSIGNKDEYIDFRRKFIDILKKIDKGTIHY